MATTKLGLPEILGNQNANIPQDVNALAQAIDDTAGETGGLALQDDLTMHSANDTVGAHTATNIAITDTNGYYTSGNTEGALNEIGDVINSVVNAPGPVSEFTATAGNAKVDLTWNNPSSPNLTGVRIIRKLGSEPAHINDGTLIYDGLAQSYTDASVTNGNTYYYKAWTYAKALPIKYGSPVTANAKPMATQIYGVAIDLTNSNPDTAVTRTDAAAGFTSESDFANRYPFNQIRPVMFKNGAVQYELQKNDFTKKLDGSAADITTGNDGDVMIEFPKVWWKIEKIGTTLHVKYADGPVTGFKCLAHTKLGVEKNFSYIGAYLGSSVSSKLRSLSGKSPHNNVTLSAFRMLAEANGSGYQLMSYFQVLMVQVLYIVRYKNRDSQVAIGRGYVDGNTAAINTGGANAKGMVFGEGTGKQQMKLFGIEDFWGNLFQFVDGIYSDASRNILLGDGGYNDAGSGYANYGQGAAADFGGYISDVQGDTETGFIVKAASGSETTYFPDNGYLNASRVAIFGGSWAAASGAGAFRLAVSQAVSYAYSHYGSRPAYI